MKSKLDFRVKRFEKHKDTRGELIVFLRNGELDDAHKRFGQIYFVTFKKKGVVRGNHYHKTWHEWFGITAGKVLVAIEDVRTKKRKEVILSAAKDKYVRIETGPYIAHAIKSLTNYACLLSYADGEWSDDDTFEYKLL
jgi:dTDP-4-dehydrorhamnose 3,5-epimerase-like enzyme